MPIRKLHARAARFYPHLVEAAGPALIAGPVGQDVMRGKTVDTTNRLGTQKSNPGRFGELVPPLGVMETKAGNDPSRLLFVRRFKDFEVSDPKIDNRTPSDIECKDIQEYFTR